jgi:hypothetical protein
LKTLGTILLFVSISLSAQAGEGPSAKVSCDGLATVGVPIDPGFSMENHAAADLKIKAEISVNNPCNGQLNCWLYGTSTMTFKSAPGFRVQFKVTGMQENPEGPVKVTDISAKLIAGNKVVAVSEVSTNSVDLINPEPYQILMNKGKPDVSLYEGYEQGLLKGNLLDEVNVRCQISK